MASIDANTEIGGMTVYPKYFPHGDDFRGLRLTRPASRAVDASSDANRFVEEPSKRACLRVPPFSLLEDRRGRFSVRSSRVLL
jgi:hypothetical protein